jgi:hypothetical protein
MYTLVFIENNKYQFFNFEPMTQEDVIKQRLGMKNPENWIITKILA